MGTVRHGQHATNSVMSSMDVDEVTRAKEKRKRLQQPWASDRCLEQDSDGKMRGRSSSRSSSRSLRTPGASRGRSRSRSPTGSRSPTDSRRSRERSRSPTRSRRSRERSRSPTRSRRSQRRRGQIVELEEKVEELTRENEIARLRVDQALGVVVANLGITLLASLSGEHREEAIAAGEKLLDEGEHLLCFTMELPM